MSDISKNQNTGDIESDTPLPQTIPTAKVAGLEVKWWVLIAVGTGTFMTALDTSVVNTILPIIQTTFKTPVNTIEWVVTIYLLIVSGLLLSFGRLGDMRGNKTVYMYGFIIFVLGSALCGLAPSAQILIVFRGFQAFGAAMLAANSPAILTKSFPAFQRGQALGLQATMTYLGLTVAPSLGGWLADLFSWRVAFYINVPVGILALILSGRFIAIDVIEDHSERFDISGALLFMTGLIALLFGLNQGQVWGWFSHRILGLLCLAILLLSTFLVVESRYRHPMLDLSLFRSRIFSASTASALINYICLFTVLFLLPFYLLEGRSFSASYTGLILTAQPIVMAIIAPFSGTLSDRIGPRLPAVLGMAILGMGIFMLSRLGPHTPLLYVVLGLIVTGLGTGMFISPNNSALMGSAPRTRQGIAAGTMATSRSAGMVLGIGIAGAIFTTMINTHPGDAGFFAGIQTALVIATGISIVGVLTSAVRER
jgi:EmrB/QacA subfamily drug resistance transporter